MRAKKINNVEPVLRTGHKNKKIIFISFILIFILALACMKKESSREIDILKEIYKGPLGPDEGGKEIINNDSTWIEFKKKMKQGVRFSENEINFEKYTLIAVYLGEKTVDGYSLEIKEVRLSNKTIKAYYLLNEPDINAPFTISYYPVHIVKIEKTDADTIQTIRK